MNTLNPIGSRPYQNLPTAQQPDGRQPRANAVQTTDASDAVSLSSKGLDMQQRVAQLGNSTVDLAQNLIGSFAQSLFGDDAKGASISFDSIDLEANSSVAAGVSSTKNADGVTSAAMLNMSESSHFLGKGTITTADGRKFDFEVEIKYEASLQAGAAASSVPSRRKEMAEQNPAMPLPTVEFPDIDFPGSLADIFKLMQSNQEMAVKQKDDEGQDSELGKLSMRLLKLVNSDSALDTYLPTKAKEVADAYGVKPALPAKAEAPATTPAAEAKPAPAASDAQAAAPVRATEKTEPLQAAPAAETKVAE
jgi:hypothetical protein